MALNIQQNLFCEYYAMDSETFGNGTASYGKAYNCDLTDKSEYNTAKANAYKLLERQEICDKIQKILEKQRLNDNFVSTNLAFLIAQNDNLAIKRQAISDYFRYFAAKRLERKQTNLTMKQLLAENEL